MSNPLFSGPLPPAFSKGDQPWPGPASANNLPAAIAWARAYASDLEKSSKDVDLSLGMHDWCKEYATHLRALVEAAEEASRLRAWLAKIEGYARETEPTHAALSWLEAAASDAQSGKPPA